MNTVTDMSSSIVVTLFLAYEIIRTSLTGLVRGIDAGHISSALDLDVCNDLESPKGLERGMVVNAAKLYSWWSSVSLPSGSMYGLILINSHAF